MKYIPILLFFLFLIIVGCPKQPVAIPVSTEEISKSELILMHNKQRALNRCDVRLTEDDYLNQKAQKWAENMARKNNMYHSTLTFNGTNYSLLGENIARGQTSTDQVVETWMNSKGHRANILNKNFNRIGVGVAYSNQGQIFWCAQFAQLNQTH